MNNPLPPIDPSRIMKFEVQSWRHVRDDLKKNWKWITGFISIIALYTGISATIAKTLDGGFIATTATSAGVVQAVTTLRDWDQAFYFTIINMTTVGFGDIFPLTSSARALAIVNSIFGLITFAGLVSVITVAFAPSGSGSGSGSGSNSGGGENGAGPAPAPAPAAAAEPETEPTPAHESAPVIDTDTSGEQVTLNEVIWLPNHTSLLRHRIDAVLHLDRTEFPPNEQDENVNARAEKLRTQLLDLGAFADLLEVVAHRYNKMNVDIRRHLSQDRLGRETGRSKL